MAIGLTSRGSDTIGGSTANMVTASFTPTASSRLYAWAPAARDNHTNNFNWSISGGGLTWNVLYTSAVVNEPSASFAYQGRLWYADVGGSPGSMTVAAHPFSNSFSAIGSLHVFEATNLDSGTPHTQTKSSPVDTDNSSTYTVNFDSTPSQAQVALVSAGTASSSNSWGAAPTNWSDLVETTGVNVIGNVMQSSTNSDTSVTSPNVVGGTIEFIDVYLIEFNEAGSAEQITASLTADLTATATGGLSLAQVAASLSGSATATATGIQRVSIEASLSASLTAIGKGQFLQANLSAALTAAAVGYAVRRPRNPEFVVGTAPSAAFLAALRSAGHYVHVVELLDESGETILFTTDNRRIDADHWGAEPFDITYDRASTEQRSGQVVIPVPQTQIAALIPFTQGHALHPSTGSKIAIWGGYRLGTYDEMYRMATVDIDEIEVVAAGDERVLYAQTIDITDRLRVDFPTAGRIESGTNVVTAVLTLISEILPPDLYRVNAKTTTFTTPLIEYEAGDGRRELIDDLLTAIGFELTSDVYGELNVAPIGETWINNGIDPRWTYGDDGLPVSECQLTLENLKPAGVAITGGKISDEAAEILAQVYDKDPNSLTFYSPALPNAGSRMMTLRSEQILSVEQAEVAGYAQLRASRVGPGFVRFQAAPNPALRDGDIVRFECADLNIEAALFTVESVSISPEADGSVMEVELRRSWDPTGERPDTGAPPPSQPPVPPTSSISDNFDRPDEDLEASSNWVEHGSSWNVRGDQAAQVVANSWCFARWTTPLATTNHRASIEISSMPFTNVVTYLGPMIRSNGQFQGYAALVHEGGLDLGLYKIQDSKIAGQLGSTWTDGLTLEGRTVEVQADGNTIVARVDGSAKITVTDNSFPGGTYVGMVARGDNPNTPITGTPRCDDFSAGTAI